MDNAQPATDWVMPTFQKPCGHEQLGEVVLSWRRWYSELPGPSASAARELLAAITPDGLRRLLELAQFASCIPEEGRFSRLSLFVRSRADIGELIYLVRLRDPTQLSNPKQLTELATVLPAGGGCAIHVEERDGQLFVLGFVNLSGHLVVPNDGQTARPALGLRVSVDGPGRLRTREIDLDVQVQDGALRTNRSIYEGRLATAWLEELRDLFLRQCRERQPGLDERAHTYAWNTVVVPAWTEVIITAVGLGHGGAVVVLPEANAELLQIKYPTDPVSYLDEINAYLCLRSSPSGEPLDDPARMAALEARHARLFAFARSLAQLTAIDGCVVLDRNLRLHGYGVKITADEAAVSSILRFVQFDTLANRQEDEISTRFGTRHRSAFRLCKACPHTLAFVLSQDGALRVFGSDNEHIFLEEDANPRHG